jgi:hypothetical protein
MSVRCGNRKCDNQNTHATPADVRACFAGLYAQSAPRTLQGLASGEQELRVAPPNATVHPAPSGILLSGKLHEGYFTVTLADGERRTFRIRRQVKDAKFAPGELLISYLSGSDNESDYTGCAFVSERHGLTVSIRPYKKIRGDGELMEALRVLAGDPAAAGKGYAEESGNCFKCNRLLTVPQGPKAQGLNPYRDAGLGPKCGEED